MRSLNLGIFLLCSLLFSLTGSAERLSPERLWDLSRIGGAAVSPDGQWVAYLVARYDLAENSGTSSLLIQSLPQAMTGDGEKALGFQTNLALSDPQILLKDIKGLGALNWLDHSTGPKLVYIAPAEMPSDPDAEAEEGNDKSEPEKQPQAWMISPDGGQPTQLTQVAGGISNLKTSPSGDAIAFTVDVKLDQEVTEIYPDLPKADARIIDSLMYRHWNQWHDYAYSHLHVVTIGKDGSASDPVDLMPGMKADCPLPPFGGSEQFTFSPDGTEIALTLKLVNNPAESTDSNVYLVGLADKVLKNITPGMPGYDMNPAYSPDGKQVAFHSMERAGFESDRNRIFSYDRAAKSLREITVGLDQTTHDATWSPDQDKIFFDSETRGTHQVYQISSAGGVPEQISEGWFNFSVLAAYETSGAGGEKRTRLLLKQQSMLRPTELAVLDVQSKQLVTITDVNGEVYKGLELPRVEERFFTATDGKQIQNWVILPPDYDSDSDKKWPMLTYCQGGPQGQIGQWFSYRWNFHMMAAKGYVVLAVNRRGLPGFGREWNDQISGDWGGQAMQDILAATDGMFADPTIDRERVAAIGASFGGYTVYWLMGNHESRFCSMISHCGVFNLESMYGSTEELFFVNWDLGGPYWKSDTAAEKYQQFSPHEFIGNWKTPLLVIHGEKDFRVPVTQGMEAFTAAQVQGVPSRFLYFPEEGHWVLSPQNGVVWGRVFFDWLDRFCKPE